MVEEAWEGGGGWQMCIVFPSPFTFGEGDQRVGKWEMGDENIL